MSRKFIPTFSRDVPIPDEANHVPDEVNSIPITPSQALISLALKPIGHSVLIPYSALKSKLWVKGYLGVRLSHVIPKLGVTFFAKQEDDGYRFWRIT